MSCTCHLTGQPNHELPATFKGWRAIDVTSQWSHTITYGGGGQKWMESSQNVLTSTLHPRTTWNSLISSSRHYCRHRIFWMCTMMSIASSNSFAYLFSLCVCGSFCLFFLPCFTDQNFQSSVGWTWWWGTHHSPIPIQEGAYVVFHHLCDCLIQDQLH